MTVFSVSEKCNFIGNDVIQLFHFAMFHGLATRGGKEYPHDPNVWANTEAPETLKIARTGRNVPPVSRPSTHMVVCERLADQLRNVPNIRLLPVEFTRLVDIRYAKGDQSWEEHYSRHDPNHYLRRMPDIARFHDEVGRYFEVQTRRLVDIVDQYEGIKTIEVESGTPPLAEVVSVRVSHAALLDHPIVYGDLTGSVFLTEAVFGLLDADIDRDFFIVRTFEI